MNFKRYIILISCFLSVTFNSTLFAYNGYPETDYIIVGVGTAGALFAKSLTDDKKTSVVAFHNGSNNDQSPLISNSENATFTVLDALIGLPFYQIASSIPQPNADNRNVDWVMAFPLGGASSINAGAYCRGTNQLYAQWEAIAGPLWSVNQILNIYKDLESYHGKTTNPCARGFFGPLSVRQNPNPSPVALKFQQAVINATGLPSVLDYNDPNTPIGASSQFQYTQTGNNGEFRASSSITFLNKKVMNKKGYGVKGRKLRVVFNSTALKVIWKGNKAIGIEYVRNGKFKKAYARKGVIVCAGIQSSAFLLHSGVGPRALLNSLGIPVIFDNPNVGQGLADQPHIVMLYTTNPNDTLSGINILPLFQFNQVISAFENTSIGEQSFQALNLPIDDLSVDFNLLSKLNKPVNTSSGLFSQFSWLPAPGGDPNIRALRFTIANPLPGIAIAILDLVQPKSRGSITINTPDPCVPPVIDLGLLTNPDDLTLFQQGFQIYIKSINAALQAIDPEYQLIFPDPAIIDDIGLLTEFIKQEIGPNMHFQSHCRMAPLEQGGVVDSTGRVYGVKNLIVADNSINPVGMDGSPMASGYLVAANIARILKHHG